MFIEDITTGTSSGDKAVGPNANTSSAECIAERPGGGSSTLADFNNVNFRNCDVNSLGHGISQDNPSKIEVTNNNKTLTSTGSISNNGQNFAITWKAYS